MFSTAGWVEIASASGSASTGATGTAGPASSVVVSGPTSGGLTFHIGFDQPDNLPPANFKTDVLYAFQYFAKHSTIRV